MAYFETYAEYRRTALYQAVRAVALARKGGMCARCGAKASEVHHAVYPPAQCWDTPDNLEPLCHACHSAAHGKEPRR